MHKLAEANTGEPPPMEVCASHEYVVKTIDRLVTDQRDGFSRLERKLESVAAQQSIRITELTTAQAVANTEMRLLNERLSERIGGVAATVDEITEVGIKTPNHHKQNGNVRLMTDSSPPRRGLFHIPPKTLLVIGAGAVLAIALIGYFVGVWFGNCSSTEASRAVKKIIVPILSENEISTEVQPRWMPEE